jgi:hypothetical protein
VREPLKDAANILAVVLVQPLMIWGAWNFIVPIFWHAAPHITLLQAFFAGIVLNVLGMFFRK